MANEEHLKILLKGVEVWNQWREDNPETVPDINGILLHGENLTRADLNRANLSGTDLSGASLYEANLRGANLREAILTRSDLTSSDLAEANLNKAILRRADLRAANLSKAKLGGAYLRRADLQGVDFQEVDLQESDLQTARLINANLDGANLTGARLWETQRSGWSIKSVICEYVYWDEKGEEKTKYFPGEFEKLFSDKTKIRLFYKNGMSLIEVATLQSLIQHLANKFPDSSLRFVSMHTDAGGAVVELAIEDTDDLSKEQIKQLQVALQTEAQAKIEYQRQALVERDTRLQLEGEVKRLDSFVDKLLVRQGNIFNNYGQAATMGDNSQAHNSTSNQIVNAENSDIATQIQGERNIAVDGDASESNITTGDNE